MLNLSNFSRTPDSRGCYQTNLRLSAQLVEKLDSIVPRGKRTAFVEEALRRELESQATALISESQK